MKKQKTFDCIEYKRKIQSEHATQEEGLSDKEIIKKRTDWLETSDNPAAKLWRELKAKKQTPVSK